MGSYTSTSKEISCPPTVGLEFDSKEIQLGDVNLDLWEVVSALKRKGFTRLTNRFGVSMDLEEACDMVLPILRSKISSSESDAEKTDLDSVAESNYGQMKRKIDEQNVIIEALKEQNRLLGKKVAALEAAVKDAVRRETAASNLIHVERKAKEELKAMHQVKDLELLRKIKRFNTSLEVDLMPWSCKSQTPSHGSLESLATPRPSPSTRGAATAAGFVTPDKAPSSSMAAKKMARANLNDKTSGTDLTRKANKDRASKTEPSRSAGCELVEKGTRNASETAEKGTRNGWRNEDNRTRSGFQNGSDNTDRTGSQIDDKQLRIGSDKSKDRLRSDSENVKDLPQSGSDDSKTGSDKNCENNEKPYQSGTDDAKCESRKTSENIENQSWNGSETVDVESRNWLRSPVEKEFRNDFVVRGTEMKVPEMEVAEANSSLQLLPLNLCSPDFNLEKELARTLCAKAKNCSVKVKDCPAKVIDSSKRVAANNQRKTSVNRAYTPVTNGRTTAAKNVSLKKDKNPGKTKADPEFQSDVAKSSADKRHSYSSTPGAGRDERPSRVGRPDLIQRRSPRTGEQRSTRDDVRTLTDVNRRVTSSKLNPVADSSCNAAPTSKPMPSSDPKTIYQTPPLSEATPSDFTRSTATEPLPPATPTSEATLPIEAPPSFEIAPTSETTHIMEVHSPSETPQNPEAAPILLNTPFEAKPSEIAPTSESPPSCETTPRGGNANSRDASDACMTEESGPSGQTVDGQVVEPDKAGKPPKMHKTEENGKASSAGFSSGSRNPARPTSSKSPATFARTQNFVRSDLPNGPAKGPASRRKDLGQKSRLLPKASIRVADRSGEVCPDQRNRHQSPAKPPKESSSPPSHSYTKLSHRDCTSPVEKKIEPSFAPKSSNRDYATVLPRPNDDEETAEFLDLPALKAEPSPSAELPSPISEGQPSEIIQSEQVVLPSHYKGKLLQPSTTERKARQTQPRKDGEISPRISDEKNSTKELTTPTRNWAKPRPGT